MNRGVLIIILFLLIGGGMYYYLKPQGLAVSSDGTVSLEVAINNRAMNPPIIRVAQGTQLELQMHSDENGIVYVDGFETTSIINKGEMTVIGLQATKTGSHGVYMHPDASPQEEIKIGTLEISPKI